jgi:diguanylate cyclase (GGDEF)-like protein/PAS domain S-box-containing protein
MPRSPTTSTLATPSADLDRESPWRRVLPGRGLALAAAGVLTTDVALTLALDEGVPPMLVRIAVLLAVLPAIAWFVSGRAARRADAARPGGADAGHVEDPSDASFVLDASGTIRRMSPAAETTLRYGPQELLGRSIEDVLAPADGVRIMDLLRTDEQGLRTAFECRIKDHDGRWLTVEAIATDHRHDPAVGGMVLTMHDVSKWKALEEQLTHQAFHDPLTGLPNRALYVDRLEQALGRRRRHAKGAAVLFLDLDDFKIVNDSQGHVEGDTLLRLAAARLAETIRPGDTAARFGGDEFALLLEEVDEDEAAAVARRVLDALDRPFQLTERSMRVGVSIGIAMSSSVLRTATDLLRVADIAMYSAKDSGKGQYRVFHDSMQQATADRLRLGVDLRAALERNEFVIHYQPIVQLPAGNVTGMEALVRWAHPERGLIPPADFIPLAESTGLIVPLGEWVLREACVQARTWQHQRPEHPISVSVNLSGVQLQHPGLVAAVSLALEDSELPPELLTLEITETVMADETEPMIRLHRHLKGIGVGLAIDDFGKGYSSLSYLRRFPIDVVKIDKSFVDGIASGQDELALLRAIVKLAHSLKMRTAAEGVESEAQAKRLSSMGCDLAQGFHFSRPMDVRHATAYLMGKTTLTMWVGHSGHELDVINTVVADFEVLNPELKVEVVGGVYDDKIIAALKAGHPPNVVSSFEPDSFGTYCSGNGLVDLGPYLKRDLVDDSFLTEATLAYTRFNGKQWALPMLADAYGLYYNKALFAEAGLTEPPRTVAQLTEYAKKLTKRAPDGSLEVVGFNPKNDFYENFSAGFAHFFGARWTDDAGRSCLATDPGWKRMLEWQKELVDWYGYDDLVKFQASVGDEFSTSNAFETGRIAMNLDGEWRVAFIAENVPDLDYGTAPIPVDELRPELYGSGYINGTIVGIPGNASHKDDSWRLVKYLATDDQALAKLSNGLKNVPSTKTSIRSPHLVADAKFEVFLDIFEHPRSSTTPIMLIGKAYKDIVAGFAAAWEAGHVSDLHAALLGVDRQIHVQLDKALQDAERAERSRRATKGGRSHAAVSGPVALSA